MLISVEKNRDESLSLQSLQAELMRISPSHHIAPILSENYASRRAGIAGEDLVADIFQKHSFTMEHRTFHDVSLCASSLFQMDTLFITTSYALIFEVKNIAGRLKFADDPPQLIRTKANGQIDGYESPAAQVQRNVDLFCEWLVMNGVYLPVYGIVVLAYPKQIVERAPAKTKILFPKLIPPYIRSLAPHPIKLQKEKLNWLTTKILKSHQPYIPHPLMTTYKIPKEDIQTGVACQKCKTLGMKKVLRDWLQSMWKLR